VDNIPFVIIVHGSKRLSHKGLPHGSLLSLSHHLRRLRLRASLLQQQKNHGPRNDLFRHSFSLHRHDRRDPLSHRPLRLILRLTIRPLLVLLPPPRQTPTDYDHRRIHHACNHGLGQTAPRTLARSLVLNFVCG
jgi:hypothetical protein